MATATETWTLAVTAISFATIAAMTGGGRIRAAWTAVRQHITSRRAMRGLKAVLPLCDMDAMTADRKGLEGRGQPATVTVQDYTSAQAPWTRTMGYLRFPGGPQGRYISPPEDPTAELILTIATLAGSHPMIGVELPYHPTIRSASARALARSKLTARDLRDIEILRSLVGDEILTRATDL